MDTPKLHIDPPLLEVIYWCWAVEFWKEKLVIWLFVLWDNFEENRRQNQFHRIYALDHNMVFTANFLRIPFIGASWDSSQILRMPSLVFFWVLTKS